MALDFRRDTVTWYTPGLNPLTQHALRTFGFVGHLFIREIQPQSEQILAKPRAKKGGNLVSLSVTGRPLCLVK